MAQPNGQSINGTVRRWQLTETLRQLREQKDLSLEQTAELLREGSGKWSRSKLSRIETREQGVRSHEVDQLLDLYGVTDDKLRAWLLDLATTAHERGYWLAIRKDLPGDFHEFLNVEAALVAFRQLTTLVMPGLLQTPDYTRALVIGANPGLAFETVERRTLARVARQQVLTRPDPLQFHVIIEEAVLERPVGTAGVMRAQLRRLIEAAEMENVTIQVLPKSAGASPALNGSFSILTLPDPIPDVGYTEGPGGAVYIEDRADVRSCIERWGILTGRALPSAQSVDSIHAASKTYE